MAEPHVTLRRSPLRRAMPDTALWGACGDAAIVERAAPDESIGSLAIADLSPVARLGFKGRGTIPAVKRRSVVVEAEPNRAFRQPGGGLCLVLGAGEVLLLGALDDSDSASLATMERDWRIDDAEATYPVPRHDSHCWLGVVGDAAPAFFAKLCAVDLRPQKFADLAIAQTSVARLNAIVVRADHTRQAAYHLLADSASAHYLLACLLDAAAEFDGKLIGRQTFTDHNRSKTAQDLSNYDQRSL